MIAHQPAYTSEPSPHTTGEVMVELRSSQPIAELVRAVGLMRSLGGFRELTVYRHLARPSHARRWALLFDAGFEAARGRGGEWRYRRPDAYYKSGRTIGVPLYSASETARRERR